MKQKRLIAAGLVACCCVAALFYPIDMRRAQLSPTLLAENGALLRAYPAPDGQIRLPLKQEEVDPLFIKMLLGYEDRHFYFHPGVDPLAFARAILQWARHGEIVSGGSTITMQVARLLHPAPRTVTIKLLEIWRAFRLEVQYSKRDILNFYLCLAPYGGNLSGLRAGTYSYFGKEPKYLTPDEAALLVVLPQNPNDFRPDRFPDAARQARAKILRLLAQKQIISATSLETGLAAPLPMQRLQLPTLAPHLADQLYKTQKNKAPWRSTLHDDLQKKLEVLLRQRVAQFSPQTTIAALVVDNRTRDVIAYAGNADYFSVQRAGQIDMIHALRSPGSTLKPFLYGMAFQDGIAQPETIIRDAPTRFGTYTPSNFNQGYQGDVSLREALQQSLNIPAVKILNQVGPERWLGKLRSFGVNLMLPQGTVTAELPIILGGLGTSLWDLMQLYTGLANEGAIAPLHILQTEKTETPKQFLNKTASWQVTNILTGSLLSDGVMRAPDLSQLAIKTGTSYGYRDAWSIGYTPNYTVGIWVGRADGSPSPGQVGRNTAIPILLAVFDLLPARAQWKTAPPGAVTAQDDLPDNLKRWIGDRASASPVAARTLSNPLVVIYPVDNSTFQRSEISMQGIKLTAQGGTKPYQWYVNGAPLNADAGNEIIFWKPDTIGNYKITLQDQSGQILTEHIFVKE